MSILRHYIRTPIVPKARQSTCSLVGPKGPKGPKGPSASYYHV